MNKKIINGLLFAAVAVSGAANAAITGPTLLNFNLGEPATPTVASNPGNTVLQSATYGTPNTAPNIAGACAGLDCYIEDGMAIGVVENTSSAGAHIHRTGTLTNRTVGYEADSTGYYIRALDSSAFSLTSMLFNASASDANPNATGTYVSNDTAESVTSVAGANDYWEILGYASALNPGLNLAADSGPWIAKQTVTNGFNGTVTLSSAFNNISAFWIHYHGYQQVPTDGKAFNMNLDNVLVNTAVSSVPVPAAVWLFGSGLMGFLYSAKRKAIRLDA